MFEIIAAPANWPFSVALLLMLMIGAVEALGLGASAVHLDVDADLDAGGGSEFPSIDQTIDCRSILHRFVEVNDLAARVAQVAAHALDDDPGNLGRIERLLR